jgi:prephenate dehydrogenase
MSLKRVAIIGTDCISVSIALGLKALGDPPEIVGYDDNAVKADLAHAREAFDKVEREPGPACEEADLVIVSKPVDEIHDTFAAIAPHLAPGCLVTDTARLKMPVMRWADELLPQHVSFIGGHLIPNPAIVGLDPLTELDAAGAKLLKEALYCLTPSPNASGTMIETFAELALSLDAHPFFIDVTEHDGIQAGIAELLDLSTIALLRATMGTPGWQEMRKFADRRFVAATEATDGAYQRRHALFFNRENAKRRLDVLIEELIYLRDLLAQGDEEELESTFAAALEERKRWIHERKRGMWVETDAIREDDVPKTGQQLGRLLFGGLADRLRGDPNNSQES